MTARQTGKNKLTHIDAQGQARMVDVSGKHDTLREAVAAGRIRMKPTTRALIMDSRVPKGDVLACARIAGIMAAKETSRLIPLCHTLPLSSVAVELVPQGDDSLFVRARVRTVGKTGVEMEALAAVCAASLTVYDMCKAIDRGMRIEDVALLEKRGGRSGHWRIQSPTVPKEEEL